MSKNLKMCNDESPLFSRSSFVVEVDDSKMSVIYFENHINVYLSGTISSSTIDPLVEVIVSENCIPEESRLEVINIFIDSLGGELHPAFKLIDVIRMSNIKVRTIGWGMVGSAALMIFMSAEERLVSKYTSLLSHQATLQFSEFNAKLTDFSAQAREFNNIMSHILEYYRSTTKKSDEFIREHLITHVDEYLTAAEALEYGLATDLLQNKNGFDFLLT